MSCIAILVSRRLKMKTGEAAITGIATSPYISFYRCRLSMTSVKYGFYVLLVDELLAVLYEDALCRLAYALTCEVVDGSVLVGSVGSNVVNSGGSVY